MASYQYKDMCYGTTAELYAAIASSCPSVNSAGWATICTPIANGYQLKNYSSDTNFKTTNITPALIDCSFNAADAIELGWLVVGVFLVAWAIRQKATVLRMR